MSLPAQTFSIQDPGLGVVQAVPTTPLFMGVCSSGVAGTLYTFNRVSDVIATLGQGPLAEAVCYQLLIAGGPVFAMRLTGSVAGAAGTVTDTAIGSSTGTVTVAGAAYDAYSVIISIVGTGANGVATFQYSLDGGLTYSAVLTVPSGGTFALPNTNLTLTFVPGAGPVIHQAGDLHTFTTTAPYYSTTNLNSGFTSLLALSPQPQFAFIALVGKAASAAAAATMAAALDVQLQALFLAFAFERAIMDAGIDTVANAKTGFAAFSSSRVAVCYGDATVTSGKPFSGWGSKISSFVGLIATRAAGSLISTDLARFADGALKGCTAISYDEFVSAALDGFRFTTLRTWPGEAGFYVGNCRLMSASGSDYQFWQHGRIMDAACATVYQVQKNFSSISVRCNADGTIDERDAQSMEARVKAALTTILLTPVNREGSPGHVSAVDYKIDRTNNVLTTFNINSTTAARPRAYGKTITASLGFSANVGG